MFIGTNNRHSEAIEFAASAREFKAQVQAAIAAVLEPLRREGESLPQLEELQELIARLLEESGGELLATDQLYTNKLVAAAALREERDALVTQLEIHMRDVRYLLDRSVGTAVAKATLRNRRLSNVKPSLLVAAARDLVKTLRDPQLALETLTDKAIFADVAQMAAKIEEEANQLEEALLRLSPQKKASQNQLGAKVAGIDAAVEKNRRCADLLFGLYRMAGLDFHAERLRPKARRRKAKEPEKAEASPPPMALMRVT